MAQTKLERVKELKAEYNVPPNVQEGIGNQLALIHPPEEAGQFQVDVSPAVPQMADIPRDLPLGYGQRPVPYPAAPPQFQYSPEIEAMRQRANQFEQQANTPPNPYQNMSPLRSGITHALRSFTAGYDPNFLPSEAAANRQASMDKLARAKYYRGQADTQMQRETEQQRWEATEAHQRAQEEQARQQFAFTQELANRPKFQDVPTAGGGHAMGQVNPQTGHFTEQQNFPAPPPATKWQTKVIDESGGKGTKMGMYNYDPVSGKLGERIGDAPANMAGVMSQGILQPWLNPDQTIGGFYVNRPGAQGAPQPGPIANPPQPNQVVPPGARRTGLSDKAVDELKDYENSVRKINDLGTTYKPEFVGPYEGRYERSKASGILSYLPFLKTPEGYGEFSALNADIKNSVIKLITGAQMGQQEAQRILQQVPTEIDKDEIWAAKYEQTKKNAQFLLDRAGQLRGIGPQQQPANGSGGNEPTATNPKTGQKLVFRNGQWQNQ